jgi:hypothetical protein
MKRVFVIMVIMVIMVIGSGLLNSCSNQPGQSEKTTQTATTGKELYVCPMHPEETSDKPGKCPKCGMDLVKKEMKADTSGMKK